MTYSKEYILDKCEMAIKKADTFYEQAFVNYRGNTKTEKGDEISYSEIVAKFVIEHKDELNKIETITRKNTYNQGHSGEITAVTNRVEERNAKELFNQTKDKGELNFIGKIVDYQTPLKDTKDDHTGKIDLLAYDGKAVYILELKKEKSKETMLRCILEAYTYWKTVDHKKLLADFMISEDTPIYAAPLVFNGGYQWEEMQNAPKSKILKDLMDELDIKGPYYIKKSITYEVDIE